MDFQSKIKKLYYSISEVAIITDLRKYVIRYWETEFNELKPGKNSSGNRIYKEKDIKFIKLLKKLLYDEKLTSMEVIETIDKYKKEGTFKEELNKFTSEKEKKNDDLQLQFGKENNVASDKSVDILLGKIQNNLESIIQILGESSN
ncbi:MAG: MerR family transcriptional regulator [Candidatus Marinimicrobia bacterium]|nr:MerR family transcriptional regulator [Candidatus Neomarinimicrobiota bacterium]